MRLKLIRESNKEDMRMQHKRLHILQKRITEVQLLYSRLQNNENVLENLTQFTLLLMTILLGFTKSRAVANNDNIFVGENSSLGYLLLGISLINLIKSQVASVKANRNGCSTLIGTLVLISYFLIGTISREDKYRLIVNR